MKTDKKESAEEELNGMIDFDTVLKYIGSCGRYQVLLIFLAYYLCLPCGMHQVAAVFLSAVPLHKCAIPDIDKVLDKEEYFSDIVLNATTVMKNGKYDGCREFTEKIDNCTVAPLRCLNNTRGAPTATCKSYVYDDTVYGTTVSTEWDLVCDRLIVGTSATSAYYAGVLVSAVIGGSVADLIGRRRTMLLGQIGLMASGLGCAFSPSVIAFAMTRFTLALFVMASMISTFVYAMEITSGRWRTMVGISFQGAISVGYMIMSGISYHWRNWRDFQIAISLVSLPFLVMWLFIPESPRWLFSKAKPAEAKEISISMAKRNGKTLPCNIWTISCTKDSHDRGKKFSPIVLFRRPRMRLVTLNVMFNWFVIALVYYGLTLNVGELVGSPYVNNTLSGLMEFGSYPVVIFLMEKVGRRATLRASHTLGGVSCLASTLANFYSNDSQALGILATVLALIGKLAVSGSFAIVYNFTAELYPTVVRSTSVGIGSMSARIGTILTPYALYLQYNTPWLSGVIFGVLSLIAGGLSSFFPDTMGTPLLSTLDEAEAFYRRRPRDTNFASAPSNGAAENNASTEDLNDFTGEE